jgi:rsbT co-antagonist protein RsbR
LLAGPSGVHQLLVKKSVTMEQKMVKAAATKTQQREPTIRPAAEQPAAESPKSDHLRFGTRDAERRRRFVDLGHEDIARILTIKNVMTENLDRFADDFFDYLGHIEEAAPLLKNAAALATARKLKREHLIAMAQGEYGSSYAEQRVRLGLLYASVGLEVRVFLGAFHHLMRAVGAEIMKRFAKNPAAGFEIFMSLKKLAFFDIAIIVDVLTDQRERIIAAQQTAIRELSTPVLQVRDRLLILPIIGLIDSERAMQLTESLLQAIRANRARMVVMDVTGVAAVDSKVANHLIQTVAAAGLMGARVIVTGLSADVAQALVALGVNLSRVNTIGDLQGGLEEAERMLGYKVVPLDALPKPQLSV